MIALDVNNLMIAFDEPTVAPIPIALVAFALLLMGLVATFALAFRSPSQFADAEGSG